LSCLFIHASATDQHIVIESNTVCCVDD